jgi:hypothetical protein
MKILVECTVVETGEYYAFELEGPENNVEDLEKTIKDSLGIMSSLIEIKITELALGTIH